MNQCYAPGLNRFDSAHRRSSIFPGIRLNAGLCLS